MSLALALSAGSWGSSAGPGRSARYSLHTRLSYRLHTTRDHKAGYRSIYVPLNQVCLSLGRESGTSQGCADLHKRHSRFAASRCFDWSTKF